MTEFELIDQPIGENEWAYIRSQAPRSAAWVDNELSQGRVVFRQHILYNSDDPDSYVKFKGPGLIEQCHLTDLADKKEEE